MSLHDSQNISVDTLPHLVLRNILSYFTYKDIFKLRCVSKAFENHCEEYLKNASEILKEKFVSKGQIINDKLNTLWENSDEFQDNLTKYYSVQLILNEIDIILFKQKLLQEYYIPGHLLDNLNNILKEINNKYNNSAQLLDIYKKFVHISKLYFYKPFVIQTDNLGIHIINILNMLKNTKYFVTVTYDTLFRTCHINAEYSIQEFKIFKTLLFLSENNINNNNYVLTDSEKSLILKQLILIADLHNSFVIRNNIYERNIEHGKQYFFDNFKEFELSCRRRIISETGHRIREIYTNYSDYNFSKEGLWCKMNCKCPLNDAPYFIIKMWKNIMYSEIMQKPNISNILGTLDNSYSFQIKFKTETISRQKKSFILEGLFEEKKKNISDTTNYFNVVFYE